jgi:hypothetical protein
MPIYNYSLLLDIIMLFFISLPFQPKEGLTRALEATIAFAHQCANWRMYQKEPPLN